MKSLNVRGWPPRVCAGCHPERQTGQDFFAAGLADGDAKYSNDRRGLGLKAGTPDLPTIEAPRNEQENRSMSEDDAVRLTVFRLDPTAARPSLGDLAVVRDDYLLQVDTTTPHLLSAAGAAVWEHVQRDRMEHLLNALQKAFTAAPISGYAAVVNVPTHLVFVAVWPWAQDAGRLAPKATQ